MRLTCPNCDAKYEVDDSAVPDSGRDVQCSNCGHAWFQLPPHLEDLPQDEEPTLGDPGPGAMPGPAHVEGRTTAPPAPAPQTEIHRQPGPRPAAGDAPGDEDDEDEGAPPAAATLGAPRRSLNDGLKRLLREEVDRETAARRAESGGLETQPELGLDAPARSTAKPPEPAGFDTAADDGALLGAAAAKAGTRPEEDAAAAPRRDLLPDIEEINSTLRANSERGPHEPGASADSETPAERKRGFRRGFGTVLLIAVLLALVYLYAPKIAARVPAAAAPLDTYVRTIDRGRTWLDGLLDRATRALNGNKASSGNGG